LLQEDHAEPHQDEKPLFRSDFTGAGRLPATRSYVNSKQMYSTIAARVVVICLSACLSVLARVI
jgi:hypothetical protein